MCGAKPIVNAHPPDQRPQFCTDWRPASCVAGFPAPVAAKPNSMPAHKRVWPDNHHGLEDQRTPTIQLDEEQTIAVEPIGRWCRRYFRIGGAGQTPLRYWMFAS